MFDGNKSWLPGGWFSSVECHMTQWHWSPVDKCGTDVAARFFSLVLAKTNIRIYKGCTLLALQLKTNVNMSEWFIHKARESNLLRMQYPSIFANPNWWWINKRQSHPKSKKCHAKNTRLYLLQYFFLLACPSSYRIFHPDTIMIEGFIKFYH